MKLYRIFILAAALIAHGSSLSAAEPLQHELLIFGSSEIAETSGTAAPTEIDEFRAAADVLFSVQRGPVKIFGEYLLSNHEQDLERFQVGWEPSEHSVIWFGRFHQASSVWNHKHHHGQFLQTSITRPTAEDWEDEGGIIPQHFVGVLSESNWRVGKSGGLLVAVGGGFAPVLTPEGLEPVDLLTLDMRRHKLGFQARMAWLPDELEDSSIGLLFARNEIAWRGSRVDPPSDFDHVDQSVFGIYANAGTGSWKLHAAAYRIETVFEGIGETSGSNAFYTGYLQLERALPHAIEAFARFENSSNTEASPYLRLFPGFVRQRTSIGARWQFARKHALTFQTGSASTASDDYQEFRLQWSAALL